MGTYIRYINEIDHAREDFERGYSFRLGLFYDSVEEASEDTFTIRHIMRNENMTEEDVLDTIKEAPNGYGFALDGLCGVLVSDDESDASVEQAMQRALEEHGYGLEKYGSLFWFPYAVIFFGDYYGEADCGDGQVFFARELKEVIVL